jgi:DNA-binding CsgD family transcriptional regulator
MIGRDSELAVVDRLLHSVKDGESAVLCIEGEPGIGKTALVSESIARASGLGYSTLSGRAAEFERDLAFGVFSDAFEPCFASLQPADLEDLIGDPGPLAMAFPSLRLLPTEEVPVRPDQRQASLRAIRTLLEGLGGDRPLMVGLDDLHWADPASVDLICQILHRPLGGPVLLLLSTRSQVASPRLVATLEEAKRRGSGHHVELHPLSATQAIEFLGDSIDPALGDQLYTESGGNPFYLEQLASAVKRGTHAPGARRSDPGQAVPRAVTAAITDEIEGLSQDAKAFLHGAAVAGESFEPELAAQAAGTSPTGALDMLDEVLRRDLIRPTEVPRRFRFRHPIVRRAVYESAGAGKTLASHGRMALELARRGASASARAHHVERSATMGDMAAVELLRAAGEESTAVSPASAAHWFKAALRLLPERSANDQLKLELLTRSATALGVAGHLDEAADALRELLKLLPPELTPVRRHAVAVAEALEDSLGNHEYCERMLMRELANTPDAKSVAAMEIATSLSINGFFRNDWSGMVRWAEEALAAEPSSANAQVAALSTLALGAYGMADLTVAEQAASKAAALFDRTPDAEVAEHDPGVAVWLGWAETCLEHLDDGLRHLERAASIARATEQRHLLPGMLGFQAHPLRLKGRLPDIQRNAEAVTELALLMDADGHRRIAMSMRSAVEVLNGDLYAAVRFAEQGVADPGRDDPPSAISRMVLAEALLEIGEPERCRQQLVFGDGTPRLPQIPFCEGYCCILLTRSELALGAVARAEAYAARAEELAARYPMMVPLSSAAHARAAVLLAQGDAESARERAAAAVECGERLGSPLISGRARILLGEALAAAGDRVGATAELECAHEQLGSFGARRYQDQAARALRKLGHAVPRRSADSSGDGVGHGLSKREIEVLSLVCEGRTNRQIADELYLSVRTVDRHVSRIFEKLGVSSRAAAVSAFERSRRTEHTGATT